MDVNNLKRAAEIHAHRSSILSAIGQVESLLRGRDAQDDIIVDDVNNYELIEAFSHHPLDLKGCYVGIAVLDAIHGILLDKSCELLEEVRRL